MPELVLPVGPAGEPDAHLVHIRPMPAPTWSMVAQFRGHEGRLQSGINVCHRTTTASGCGATQVTTVRLHWRNSATAAQVRPLDHRLPSDKVSRRRDRPTAWSISAIPTRTQPLGEGGRPEPHAVARQ